MRRLCCQIMNESSRVFAELQQAVLWPRVKGHAGELSGARLTGFICDDVTEAWIDFRYRSHSFSVNDEFGEYWFSVLDTTCSDEILREVLDHFARILRSTMGD